ncbi:MAG: hypothetical protein LBO07_06890 [Coriobacteriales bacterium]|jgi:ribosomal protein L37AE/L43A|nr:hypothetical protein [Coriobacteriales bacterium]
MSAAPKEASPIHDVTCPSCHADDFTVIDESTGLLRCSFCRNAWIDEHFVKLTETERYLREQAKQPRVITDNSTETDRQLLQAVSGLSGFMTQVGAVFRRALSGCVVVAVLLIVLAILAIILPIFLK